MNGALRAMLEGVIDYAGLFPPAKLGMAEAVDEYLQTTQAPEKWLVDRFACSAGKLSDLAVELTEHPEEPFIPVSVIGSVSPDQKHWRPGIEHDAQEMTKFQQAAENHAEIQAYEVRFPDHQHIEECVRDMRQFTNIDLFAELPWGPEMNESLAALAELEVTAAKVRTGGLEASAFPSASELAGFIQQCVQLDLTFKLTAGLHHPLPTQDPETGATMHGFLNVLVANALALKDDLSRKEVEEILLETDPKALAFKRDGFTWHGRPITLEDAENSRTLLVSFGSCSVREPLEELGRIGLLEKVAP